MDFRKRAKRVDRVTRALGSALSGLRGTEAFGVYEVQFDPRGFRRKWRASIRLDGTYLWDIEGDYERRGQPIRPVSLTEFHKWSHANRSWWGGVVKSTHAVSTFDQVVSLIKLHMLEEA